MSISFGCGPQAEPRYLRHLAGLIEPVQRFIDFTKVRGQLGVPLLDFANNFVRGPAEEFLVMKLFFRLLNRVLDLLFFFL